MVLMLRYHLKKKLLPYLDKLSPEAESTQSVNTIYLDEDTIIGHNTDIEGFEQTLKDTNFNVKEKKSFHTWCRWSSSFNYFRS